MKNIISVIVYTLSLLFLTLFSMFGEGEEYSFSERRPLAEKPVFSAENVISGNFMSEFERYSTDNFPLRDGFRRIKALFSHYVLNKKDNNKLYVADGHISSLEYPMNPEMITNACNKFDYIYKTYLKDKTDKIYLSVIPDKNYFIADENGYPEIDYQEMIAKLCDNMKYSEYINIFPLLTLDDYYSTDSHWKQENITHIAEYLGNAMGKNTKSEYDVITKTKEFSGVYLGQSALPIKKDELKYLTNNQLSSADVLYYDTGTAKRGELYNMQKAHGKDPYEMFLSGTSALIEIENKSAPEGTELVLFRDSFGSSLAPLLVPGYRKITIIDIRYIQSALLGEYVDFNNADVLFLYSITVLNNSMSLR